jgi:hypothetical protein
MKPARGPLPILALAAAVVAAWAMAAATAPQAKVRVTLIRWPYT